MGQHPLGSWNFSGASFGFGTLNISGLNLGELSVGLALVFSLPRLLWVYQLMQCDAGGLACLTDIAVSSSEVETAFVSMIGDVLNDRLWIEMGFASLIMGIGWWHSQSRELKYWLILSALGILVLGLSISTLRSYHFRVLIVPMFVLAIQGLYRLGKKGLGLGCLWIGLVIIHRIEPVSWYNDVEQADAVAEILCQHTDALWLEGFGAELTVSPRSVGVAMVVQGCDVTIAHRPTDQIWLIHRVR